MFFNFLFEIIRLFSPEAGEILYEDMYEESILEHIRDKCADARHDD